MAVLLVLLVLAVGGCVCVVWAARGGPAWVRAAARLTIGAGTVVGRLNKGGGSNRGNED